MPRQRYDIYLNTPRLGTCHAADCIVEEAAGQVTRVALRYREAFLEHPAAFPLDPVALPLAPGEQLLPCVGGLPGFLDDYLPDGWGRKVLARLAFYQSGVALNANSAIDMLGLLGESRIGALAMPRHGEAPSFAPGQPVSLVDRAEALAQQVDGGVLESVDLNAMNLLYLASHGSGAGGARPKALLYDEAGCYLAKFNRHHRDPYNNARVELACLAMARQAGLEALGGRVVGGINEREVLLLERFDIDDAGARHHLVTINALLKDPETQRDAGLPFRYDQVCDLLRRFSVAIEADLRQLLRLMLFNRSINNTDDHERNFSLIHRGEGYRLAPAYDLLPSLATGEYPVAGFGLKPWPPTVAEVKTCGRVFGLSKSVVAEIADEVGAAVSAWPEIAAANGVSEEDAARVGRVLRI